MECETIDLYVALGFYVLTYVSTIYAFLYFGGRDCETLARQFFGRFNLYVRFGIYLYIFVNAYNGRGTFITIYGGVDNVTGALRSYLVTIYGDYIMTLST